MGAAGGEGLRQGKAVQVDPIGPMLKLPGSKRSKLKYGKMLSSVAFNFNLRHYAKAHGSYHAISGGWISEGLLDLTGCPTETIELDAPEGFDSERAWLRMLSYATAGQGPFN